MIDGTDRRQYLGSSDAPSIMGVGYKSPVQLYLEKIGQEEPNPLTDNEAVQWGQILEPLIINVFEQRNHGVTYDHQAFALNEDMPFIGSHVDALFMPTDYPGAGTEVLEVKNVGYHKLKDWGEDLDDIPAMYHWQVAHHLLAHDLQVCHVAVLIGGQNYRQYRIERNPALEERLLDAETAFWQCVQNRTPPKPKTTEDCRRLFKNSIADAIEVDDVEVLEAWQKVQTISKMVVQLEQQKDQHLALIQCYMRQHEALTANGEVIATWKGTKTKRIDVEKLRQSFPDVAEQCLVEIESRRFLLKAPKKEKSHG